MQKPGDVKGATADNQKDRSEESGHEDQAGGQATRPHEAPGSNTASTSTDASEAAEKRSK